MTPASDARRQSSDGFTLPPLLRAALGLAALGSWLALVTLSLVPGWYRPHTGLSGNAEHFVAYLLAALVTRLVFPRASGVWQVVAFTAVAAVFEICQAWIPGRSPGVDNWAASSLGALAGVLAAQGLIRLLRARAIGVAAAEARNP